MRRSLGLLLLALAALAFGACNKQRDKATGEDPLRVNPAERDRGLQACKAYFERACRCAKANVGFKKICDEADTHSTSLRMMLDTIVSDEVDNTQRLRLIKSARRTIETCFSATAQMDPRVCPAAK